MGSGHSQSMAVTWLVGPGVDACSHRNMHASENFLCCLVVCTWKDSKVPHPLFRSFFNQSGDGAYRKRCTIHGKAFEHSWRPIFNGLLYPIPLIPPPYTCFKVSLVPRPFPAPVLIACSIKTEGKAWEKESRA